LIKAILITKRIERKRGKKKENIERRERIMMRKGRGKIIPMNKRKKRMKRIEN